MPIKNHNCMYACNEGIKCMCTDCNYCLYKPDNTNNEATQENTSLSNLYEAQ